MTFGTTFADTRAKTIDAVEAAIQKAHPDIPVFEAYTSHIIIDRVKAKEGIQKMIPEEALANLKLKDIPVLLLYLWMLSQVWNTAMIQSSQKCRCLNSKNSLLPPRSCISRVRKENRIRSLIS